MVTDTLTIVPVSITKDRLQTVYNEQSITSCALCIKSISRYLKREGELSIEALYPFKTTEDTIELVDVLFNTDCFTDNKRVIASFWYDGKHIRSLNPPNVLYNQYLLAVNNYAPVLIVSDAYNAHKASSLADFIPICKPAGVKDIISVNFKGLAGREVYIYPNDSAKDRKEAQSLALFLKGACKKVIIIEPISDAKRICSSGAGIAEAIQVQTPWELAEYIKSYAPAPELNPVQKPVLIETESTGVGLYRDLYDYYRGLIKQGMKKKHINSFLPNQTEQATAAMHYTDGHIRFSDGLGWVAYDPKTGTFSHELGKHLLRYCLEIMARERWDTATTEDKQYQNYAKDACSNSGIRNVMKSFESKEAIITVARNYDSDPYLLNCQGTTVDLRTGKRRPSSPQDLYTKTTLCKPAEGVPNPEDYPVFAQFLIEVTNRNPTVIGWLMRFLGYSLSGDTKAAFFVNLHGAGRNGKGTLLHVMRQIFADYAREIPTAVVVDNGKYQNINHAHAKLLGVRLGIAADVPPGRMNIESLKGITGNDELNAEFKYKESFTFQPIVKIILSTNEQLQLPDTGQSIKSRLRYIPFSVSFAGREDTTLEQRIMEEAPEILAALIGESVEYFKRPGPRAFPDCQAIEEKTAEYIASEDILGQFLEECTVQAQGEQVGADELYQKYREWSIGRGEKRPLNIVWFCRKIGNKVEKNRSSKQRGYMNIKIKGVYD
jgi:putative DNA primase/helicase